MRDRFYSPERKSKSVLGPRNKTSELVQQNHLMTPPKSRDLIRSFSQAKLAENEDKNEKIEREFPKNLKIKEPLDEELRYALALP